MSEGELRTIDFVVAALHRLGGASRPVDIEDIAMECFRLAPDRFRWRKHPEQIDIAGVRDGLSDARKPNAGRLVVGNRKHGWTLTAEGEAWALQLDPRLSGRDPAGRIRLDVPVRAAERQRVLSSRAYLKAREGRLNDVTAQEVRELLRIDRQVTTEKYRQRVSIVTNSFADDDETRDVIRELETRYREGRLR